MLIYDMFEQAQMRLSNSTVMYQGRAVHIDEVRQTRANRPITLDVTFYPVWDDPEGPAMKRQRATIDITDPDLDFRNFPLGYLNSTRDKMAQFVTRPPRRQQVQGLQRRQLVNTAGGNLSEQDFYSQPFEDMLTGVYPSPERAMEMLAKEGWQSVAISRNLAIAKVPKVNNIRLAEYRGRTVGVAVGKTFDHFLLNRSAEYLSEVLTEAGFPFRIEEE